MSEWLLLAGGGIRPVVTVDGELVTPAEAQRRTVIRCGCEVGPWPRLPSPADSVSVWRGSGWWRHE